MPKRRRLGKGTAASDESPDNTVNKKQNTIRRDDDIFADQDEDMVDIFQDSKVPANESRKDQDDTKDRNESLNEGLRSDTPFDIFEDCTALLASEWQEAPKTFNEGDLETWRNFSLSQQLLRRIHGLERRTQDLQTIINLKDDRIIELSAKKSKKDAKAKDSTKSTVKNDGPFIFTPKPKDHGSEKMQWKQRYEALKEERDSLMNTLSERAEEIGQQAVHIHSLEENLGRLQEAMAGMGQMSHGSLVHRESRN